MDRFLSVLYSGLYVLLAGGFILLAVLSRREELPSYARDPPVLRPLRRMAFWICRRVRDRRQARLRDGGDLRVPGAEGVRSDLQTLYPVMKAKRQEVRYQTEKMEKILALLLLWILLAGSLHIRALRSGILQDNVSVERSPAGGEDLRLRVKALPASDVEAESGEGRSTGIGAGTGTGPEADSGADPGNEAEEQEEIKDYGTYTVTIHARRYTRGEAEERAQEILDRFPDALLGNNTAPDMIRAHLSMPHSSEMAPFAVTWESSRYAVLDTDGSVFNSEYTPEQAESVDLTVALTYAGYRFQKKMSFVVRAPLHDEREEFRGEIRSALQSAEEESASGPHYTLPREVAGQAIDWREQAEDISGSVLLLGAAACAAAWYILDSRLHEKTRQRSRQLALDYPKLTSKFVLYLGAGMSVRNVFYKCASDSLRLDGRKRKGVDPADVNAALSSGIDGKSETSRTLQRGKKSETRWLGEELLLVCNELESGISETEAYMHFGRRCRLRQYSRLSSLLVQNLRRGNDTLLQVLQEEARTSFEERKNLARELGEEAGTKLLLPMMIMLGVTMLIIIVPAYFGFSM